MAEEQKNKGLVSAEEHNQVARKVLAWLNTCPYKPVFRIDFENLANDDLGMCISAIQGIFVTRRYIDGGYEAQYQFKIVYRNQPGSNDERLEADEILDKIGSWAEYTDKPNIGEGRVVKSIRRNTASALFAKYDDGTQDNQIMMTLTYEVI